MPNPTINLTDGTALPTPPTPFDKKLESILEQLWLDGAQLSGGAYLGKRTLTVVEAIAAIKAAIRASRPTEDDIQEASNMAALDEWSKNMGLSGETTE